MGIVAGYVDTAGLAVQTWVDDELVALLPATRKRQRSNGVRFAQLLDRPFVCSTAHAETLPSVRALIKALLAT